MFIPCFAEAVRLPVSAADCVERAALTPCRIPASLRTATVVHRGARSCDICSLQRWIFNACCGRGGVQTFPAVVIIGRDAQAAQSPRGKRSWNGAIKWSSSSEVEILTVTTGTSRYIHPSIILVRYDKSTLFIPEGKRLRTAAKIYRFGTIWYTIHTHNYIQQSSSCHRKHTSFILTLTQFRLSIQSKHAYLDCGKEPE